MKTRLWLSLAAFTSLFVLMNPCTNLRVNSSLEIPMNEGIEEARAKFQEAYNATVEAERTGAEVSEAVRKLNDALGQIFQAEELAAQGDLEKAFFSTQASIQLSKDILNLTQDLEQQAEALKYTRLIVYIAISVVLTIFCICAFFLGKRMWKRHQRNKFMEMRIEGKLDSK